MNANAPPLIEVDGLEISFATSRGTLKAVEGVSFSIARRRTLGLVGESGCGKTVTALSLLRLVPPPGRISGGSISFDGRDLLALPEAGKSGMEGLRGSRIGIIFQEPASALNPVFTIGDQIAEVFEIHYRMLRKHAWKAAVAMLEKVGIPEPALRARSYPHQLSGGMRQRAMIALALACRPALLIADEPTTALDVTIQAQILDLMLKMQAEMGTAILFISHNLGVVSEIADEVAVMYAGRIVEHAPARRLFRTPIHPYTRSLMETLPRIGGARGRLPAIAGRVPDLRELPPGCRFSNRCALADRACREGEPELTRLGGIPTGRHAVACFKAEP